MSAPPDRIWLQTSGDYEGASAAMDEVTWCDQPMQDGDHEYILRDGPTMQAALAAARAEGREQGLRVRPLEWTDCTTVYPDGSGRKVAVGYAPLSPGYTIYESPSDGLHVVSGTGFSAYHLPDLETARTAAQADHEAYIAIALLPPEPRE